MMNNKIDNEVTNDLIRINNDRITGYKKAIEGLRPDDKDLKPIFLGLCHQSDKYKSDLSKINLASEEPPESNTSLPGEIYRNWIYLKMVFSAADRQSVLRNAVMAEEAIQKAYQSALDIKDINNTVKSIVEAQQTELKAAHNHIKILRDSLSKST